MSLRVIIVGAGHAGGTIAVNLRQYGFEGTITLIGDEHLCPYQRPPLSKAWLKGEADHDSLLLRPLDWYRDNDVDLRLGHGVDAIHPESRSLILKGETLAYDALVLATGARARRLKVPGANLSGVLALRGVSDAEALRGCLGQGKHLAVVGGGYVGLEAAASAIALGGEATVLEREDRLLARVASEPLSRFYMQAHQRRGVNILTQASVIGFDGLSGAVSAVALADGRRIACDTALVGVGAQPNAELALAAGLVCRDGVVVDEDGRTSDANIYAAGDVTFRPLPLYETTARLESVPSALEQAKCVAAAITGRPRPTSETPWFWSDQFDLKLQMAGLAINCDRAVLRGDLAAEAFALFHLRGQLVQAVEAVNAPQAFMAGRQLIGRRARVDEKRLADPSVSMKDVELALSD